MLEGDKSGASWSSSMYLGVWPEMSILGASSGSGSGAVCKGEVGGDPELSLLKRLAMITCYAGADGMERRGQGRLRGAVTPLGEGWAAYALESPLPLPGHSRRLEWITR
jgi:hypothetical protein